MAKRTIRRDYSAEEILEAIELTKKLGPTAASRQLGIPITTLSTWKASGGPSRIKVRAQSQNKKPSGATSDGAETTELPPQGPATIASSPAQQCALSVKEGGDRNPQPTAEQSRGQIVSPREKRKIARVYTPSQREQALERAAVEGITTTARDLGVSRSAIYDWKRKLQLVTDGIIPELDASSAQGAINGQDREAMVLEQWQVHPGLGPMQIRNQLKREKAMKISVHAVRCIMEEHGYQSPKVRRKAVHDRRYEACRPNHLWHLDFLHQYIHNQKIYVLILLDDFSRFITGCAIWEGERAEGVVTTFEEAIGRHGRPEMVMTDGGSAFWSWRGVSRFTRYLEELNIDQIVAKVPQHNGKIEVLNANLRKELFGPQCFFDLDDRNGAPAGWHR